MDLPCFLPQEQDQGNLSGSSSKIDQMKINPLAHIRGHKVPLQCLKASKVQYHKIFLIVFFFIKQFLLVPLDKF